MNVYIKRITKIVFIVFLMGLAGNMSLYILGYGPRMVELDENRAFVETEVTAVEANVNSADIRFLPIDGNEVKVHLYGAVDSLYKDFCEFETQIVNGNTLEVKVKLPEKRRPQWFGFGGTRRDICLEILLPRKVYKRLVAQTCIGKIYGEDLSSDSLDFSSITGDISLNRCYARTLAAKTNNGNIRLAHVEGKITVSNIVGNIDISTENIYNNISAENNKVGKISIYTKKLPAMLQLELKVINGNIEVDWPDIVYRKIDKYYLKGYLGINGPTIQARTNVGDIGLYIGEL